MLDLADGAGLHRFTTIASRWSFDPILGTGLIVVAVAYFWAVQVVNRRAPEALWPRRHSVSFLSGLTLLWIVLLGPIGSYDDVFFWAHMTQHLIEMMVAAPLLLFGSPVLLILRASSRAARRQWLVPVLRSRLVHWLTHPGVGWAIFAGTLFGTHFTGFYDFALRHPLVHDYVEHPLFLVAALIYYYPLLPGNPTPRRVPYALRAVSLFTMMIPETMTGFFIYASNYLLYPYYAHVHRPFGPAPIADQQLGGALMWAGSMVIDSVWVTLAVLDWLRSEERKAVRLNVQTLGEIASAPRPSG